MNYLVVCVGCFDIDWRVFLTVTVSRRVCVLLLVTDNLLRVCWLTGCNYLLLSVLNEYINITRSFNYVLLKYTNK